MSPLDNNDDSAKARKRRIELRAGKGDDDTCQDSKRLCLDESQEPEGPVVPSLRGIKRQTRYEPGVPMTKDQLTTWRKEARRVRNRESAAASRHKTKERIDELEGQITKIQSKYEAALRRIAELEGQGSSYKSTAFPVPPRVSPQCSPKISPLHEHDSFSLDQFSDANLHTAASQLLLPSHDIYPSMISRPTAISQTGNEDCETSNSDASTTDQASSWGSETSSWEESSDSVSVNHVGDPEEAELTKFLMDTFGNEDSTINDLVAL